jgi:hypothetical protein
MATATTEMVTVTTDMAIMGMATIDVSELIF